MGDSVLSWGLARASFRDGGYGDFRKEDAYFAQAFDLILDVYDIPHSHTAVSDLRESLRAVGPEHSSSICSDLPTIAAESQMT